MSIDVIASSFGAKRAQREDIFEAINYRNVKTRRVKLSRDRSDAKDPSRKCHATTGLIFFIFGLRRRAPPSCYL